MIKGVVLSPEKQIQNAKGDIYHVLKESSEGYAGFGEAYFSSVGKGTIKGWKRHNEMTLNLVVPVGSIRFIIHEGQVDDDISDSFVEVILNKDNYSRLTIPPGLWVGFQGLANGLNLLLNIIDAEHDPNEADDVDISFFNFKW